MFFFNFGTLQHHNSYQLIRLLQVIFLQYNRKKKGLALCLSFGQKCCVTGIWSKYFPIILCLQQNMGSEADYLASLSGAGEIHPFALFLVSTGAECRDSLSRWRPTCHDKEHKKHTPATSHFYRTRSKGYFMLAAAKKQRNQPQRNVINYYFFCISKLPELIIWRVYTEPVGQTFLPDEM
jgi:hypothetical protein